jgi:hypothetical protein
MADNEHSSRRYFSQLVMGKFHGLASTERLRRNGLNTGGFEFGQRRLKDVLHAGEVFDQAPGPGGAEARGKGKGQPMQGEAFAGSGTNGQGFGHFTLQIVRLADSYIRQK